MQFQGLPERLSSSQRILLAVIRPLQKSLEGLIEVSFLTFQIPVERLVRAGCCRFTLDNQPALLDASETTAQLSNAIPSNGALNECFLTDLLEDPFRLLQGLWYPGDPPEIPELMEVLCCVERAITNEQSVVIGEFPEAFDEPGEAFLIRFVATGSIEEHGDTLITAGHQVYKELFEVGSFLPTVPMRDTDDTLSVLSVFLVRVVVFVFSMHMEAAGIQVQTP
jgi:hypothetical protein